MFSFQIVYDESNERAVRHEVALEADHAAQVLAFFERYHVTEPVELWRDGECLGNLERSTEEGTAFWRVTA